MDARLRVKTQQKDGRIISNVFDERHVQTGTNWGQAEKMNLLNTQCRRPELHWGKNYCSPAVVQYSTSNAKWWLRCMFASPFPLYRTPRLKTLYSKTPQQHSAVDFLTDPKVKPSCCSYPRICTLRLSIIHLKSPPYICRKSVLECLPYARTMLLPLHIHFR